MKFRCERDTLAHALAACGRAASGRSGSLPVLSGLRMVLVGDRLTITGSDLDLTIETTIEVGGIADGSTVVPARLTNDVVRSLGAPKVEWDATGEQITISAGRAHFEVRPMSIHDYPRLPTPAETSVELDVARFGEALRQVVRAASTDEARPILTGVMLASEGDGLRLVATDSYRLTVADLPGVSVLADGQKVLVPARALSELQRVMSGPGVLTLRIGERDARFEVGNVSVTSRLVEGEFPNYRQLIPASSPNLVIVNRDDLTDVIRRVKILARDATPIRLSIGATGVDFTAVAQDVGNVNDSVDATYEGAEMVVAFNPDYLASGVEACDGPDVTIEFVDALKPAVIRAVGKPDFLYLLMPVRVP